MSRIAGCQEGRAVVGQLALILAQAHICVGNLSALQVSWFFYFCPRTGCSALRLKDIGASVLLLRLGLVLLLKVRRPKQNKVKAMP